MDYDRKDFLWKKKYLFIGNFKNTSLRNSQKAGKDWTDVKNELSTYLYIYQSFYLQYSNLSIYMRCCTQMEIISDISGLPMQITSVLGGLH